VLSANELGSIPDERVASFPHLSLSDAAAMDERMPLNAVNRERSQ
jgi:hypothetical protein